MLLARSWYCGMMSRIARRESVVERAVCLGMVGMTWCCVGRRVNNLRCGLGDGRWFAMDGSDSRLTTARAAWSPRSSSIHPPKPCSWVPRYRGTQVPRSLTSSALPAGTSCCCLIRLSADGPVLSDPPIRWRSRWLVHRHRQGSELGCRPKVPCQQVHGRQKGRKLSQLRHLVAATAIS